MGKFSDRIRKVINPAKAKLVEFNRQHGLHDDARMIPLEQMEKPHDAYFIRLTDNHNAFVKFKDGEYFVQENPEFSCLWDLKTGTEFIKSAVNADNLELVRLDQVIKK